jgi:CheY-like chemotaxis protein
MDVPKELGSIQADARKVKQIVYNLLSNAVKFTVDGGQVKLAVSKVPRSEVGRVDGSWNSRNFPMPDNDFEKFLRISVTDTGIGISPEGLDDLFNPFSQIDSGLARKYEGTGLGLVLLKNLAELHGGSVATESAVGEGSRFTVWLPLRPPKSATRTPNRVPVFDRINGAVGVRTALVVEDDFKSADLVRVQLEAEGFEVIHAASAEAALVLAIQQPLALITLDIMLPNMDGWELLTRLKQVPELRRIPVVIISIVADPSKGFSLGASAVMQKPISRQDLLESLGDLGLLTVAEGRGFKVLVVDDDPKAVEVVAVRIQAMGSTVLRAYNGRDAIDMAREQLPDVIVLDLMMPEVSGFDVVSALSASPKTASIPVIVVTALDVSDAERAQLNGFVTAIMEKASFNPEDLTTEVRRAMAGRLVPV